MTQHLFFKTLPFLFTHYNNEQIWLGVHILLAFLLFYTKNFLPGGGGGPVVVRGDGVAAKQQEAKAT